MMSPAIRIPIVLCACLLTCVVHAAAPTQAELEAALNYLPAYTFGESREPLTVIDRAVYASGSDPAVRKPLELAFIEMLRGDSTPDAKRYICRHLGAIGTQDAVPAIVGLLNSPETRTAALTALERIPGLTAREALCAELSAAPTSGKLGVIQAISRRGEEEAAPCIMGAKGEFEETQALPMLAGLAELGSADACRTFKQLLDYGEAKLNAIIPGFSNEIGDACLKCAEIMSGAGFPEDAKALYAKAGEPTRPDAQRAAALLGQVETQPEAAPGLIAAALTGSDPVRAKAALGIARMLDDPRITETLAALIGEAAPDAKVLLIEALADRGDPAAAPAIVSAAKSAEGEVLRAAIRAIGVLGGVESLPMLMEIASTGSADLKRAARVSLATLPGDGVNEALIAIGKDSADPRAEEALTTLGARRAAEVKPVLMSLAASGNEFQQGAALKALEGLADSADIDPLFDLAAGLPSDARDRVEKTIVAAALRGGDGAARVAAARWARASDAAQKAGIVRVLGGVQGDEALKVVAAALKDSDTAVRSAAIASLAGWASDAPLEHLLAAVKSESDPAVKSSALDGYLRVLARSSGAWLPARRLAAYEAILPDAVSPDSKKQIIGGVSQVPALESIELLSKIQSDDALKAEADLANVKLAMALRGAYPVKARELAAPYLSGTDRTLKAQAQAVVKALDEEMGYLTAWQVAGPYMEKGMTAGGLFDIAFAPETDPASVDWRLLPPASKREGTWPVDLLEAVGGSERVVYLRTVIDAKAARDAVLELGTNDGVKVWLNGTLVHSVNAGRFLACGQDTIPLKLNAGENALMLAVYQYGGEWGVCARITDGKEPIVDGVSVRIP